MPHLYHWCANRFQCYSCHLDCNSQAAFEKHKKGCCLRDASQRSTRSSRKQQPQRSSSPRNREPSVSTKLTPQGPTPTGPTPTTCLRCGKRFPSRNKLMRHLFPSSAAQPCSEALALRSDRRSDRQIQHEGAEVSFSEPCQTNHSGSNQANLSFSSQAIADPPSSQPSAVTSLPQCQPSLPQWQPSQPQSTLSSDPSKAVGTQQKAIVGGRDSSGSVTLATVMEMIKKMERILERFEERDRLKLVQATRTETSTEETLTKEALTKDMLTEKTSAKEMTTTLSTGSTTSLTLVQLSPATSRVVLPRPPPLPSLFSDSGTDNGAPIAPRGSAGLTYSASCTDDSSDDLDGQLDRRDRSYREASPGQGKHHYGSGTNHGGYVRKDDGDTGALMPWIHASSVRGSGSSCEDDGHSGDMLSCDDDSGSIPDEAADGAVDGTVNEAVDEDNCSNSHVDCYDYSDEDYGAYSDYDDDDDGYDYYD